MLLSAASKVTSEIGSLLALPAPSDPAAKASAARCCGGASELLFSQYASMLGLIKPELGKESEDCIFEELM